jgi:16S rRNA C967 or C1407 C5-methylase (RsmB/RsmF family)
LLKRIAILKFHFPHTILPGIAGLPEQEVDAFINAHSNEPSTSIRLNPCKIAATEITAHFEENNITPIPWCSTGYWLAERPAFVFDPLFHAGVYYVQESSSMFLEQALRTCLALLPNNIKVLDACAAPGGKSTLIQSIISNKSLLVANEVIQSRAQILKENIIKWGAHNVVVTQNDPLEIGAMHAYFDVIVADVPCSGSGLFRKEPEWAERWSLEQVHFCAARQKRIIEDLLPALKPNGYLIYSTCSFSKEEDEDLLKYFIDKNVFKELKISYLEINKKIVAGEIGYRFFPHKTPGEGFYIAILQKVDHVNAPVTVKGLQKHKLNIELIKKLPAEALITNINWQDKSLLKYKNYFNLLNNNFLNDLYEINNYLKIMYFGNVLLEEIGKMLNVAAEAVLMQENILALPMLHVDKLVGLHYLKGNVIQLNEVANYKGFLQLAYKNKIFALGKAVQGRVNNYVPKAWRIRKELW